MNASELSPRLAAQGHQVCSPRAYHLKRARCSDALKKVMTLSWAVMADCYSVPRMAESIRLQ